MVEGLTCLILNHLSSGASDTDVLGAWTTL